MCKCPGVVRYDKTTKKLLYYDDCNWLPVPAEAIGGAAVGGTDDWDGQSPLPPTPALPHELYTTMDAMKCAKATALVNQIWDLLTVYESLEVGATLTEAVEAVWGIVGISGDAWVFNAVSTAFFHATGAAYADIADELENIWVDDGLKADIICALVDQMEAPKRLGSAELFGQPILLNALTANDIKAAVDTFKEATPDADYAHKWIGVFPIESWQKIVTPKVPSTECGCETYSPTPSIPDGYGAITAHFTLANNVNNFPDANGTPQQSLDSATKTGHQVSVSEFVSRYQASVINQALAVMFVAPPGSKITRLKYSFQWAGTADSGDQFDLGIAHAQLISQNWQLETEGNIPANLVTTPDTSPVFDWSSITVKYILMNYAAYGTLESENGILRLFDVKFDIRADDNSWSYTNVRVGQLIPIG